MAFDINKIVSMINNNIVPPYPYAYPTRSSYRDISKIDLKEIWENENNFTNEIINLYIHYPFCRYKCGFCNLYSMACNDEKLQHEYIEALCMQLRSYKDIISKRNITTIFLGGGTPMMISENDLEKITNTLTEISPNWRNTVEEFCIEASPDTIVKAAMTNKLRTLVQCGITRINIGIQSFKQNDIKNIGRDYEENVNYKAIKLLKDAKIKNISTDLIAGFEGQQKDDWLLSVNELVKLKPHTISTYCLRIRPDSKFGKQKRYAGNFSKFYDWYEEARKIILSAGYRQETNVRYTLLDEGGYRQQDYQFRSLPVLGIGAGARSYTSTVDYIIGGSSNPSIAEIYEYIAKVKKNTLAPTRGFILDDEERIRRMLVLNLYSFDLDEVHNLYGYKYDFLFLDLLAELEKKGLVSKIRNVYQLSYEGIKYRDIISWAFFSDKVSQLDTEFFASLEEKNKIANQ